jgi:hypothetical protein
MTFCTTPAGAQLCSLTNIIVVDDTTWPIILDRNGLDDIAWGMTLLDDGGFVVVGETNYSGSPNVQAWIVRYNSSGGQVWAKPMGGNSADAAYSVKQSDDGNLIVCGKKTSATYGSGGNKNAWFFKLSLSTGELVG